MLDASPHRLLALDYDGTLAPFRVDRRQAFPLPGVVQALEALASRTDTKLAIISGRPLRDLKKLLRLSEGAGLTWVGSHGFEGQRADGETWTRRLTAMQSENLLSARRAVEALGHGARLENKPSALAFHTRGMESEEAKSLEKTVYSVWTALADTAGLRIHAFDGGVEIRVTTADKGQALKEWVNQQAAGAFVVYVGDDRTDEDAFEVAQGFGGIGIHVGYGETCALGTLADCEAVLAWLQRWARMPTYGKVGGIT
ncbi:MAG TPA: trehalose-phosphatase [Polyangiaceae bacterium]|nr:trehalose-phosphatase [Polyangiaceae bacterium]HNZ22506.1 trehalose-phosphatase [Polyangiaceae bacterium]HOD22754.1 trehalose-phosphatase [Polyangiaceae bacterium]HOE48512.1 trehalose-phosphatase [Polyangiaceae bacterium]HOH00189.1 trehalose-phosphatase [Polyangiaceae bacterium]